MAGSYGGDPWRRPSRCGHADPHDDEPEEGEIVAGDHSDVDTEEYYNRHCPLSDDSDETISDSNADACSVPASYDGDATSRPSPVVAANNNASSSSAPAAHACPICGKEFRSQKAVCGHMKVHQLPFGSQQKQGIRKDKGIKRDVVEVVAGWGGSGKRGCLGLGSKQGASPNAGVSDQSMAIVVAEPQIVFQPMPLAFASPNLSPSPVPMSSAMPIQPSVSTASASPIQSPVPVASATTNVSGQSSTGQPTMHNDAMDSVAAGPANPPPSEAVVDLHAAPAPAVQHVVDQHAAPPPAAAAAGRQNPNGYTCPECNLWFQTHQGLGGHVAGHRNREHAAAAAGMVLGEDGAGVPCRRNAKPEKAHVCKVCGAVFLAGVQLGGHMRKHYTGAPIVPNKKPRLVQPLVALPPPDLTLGLLPTNADADVDAPLQHDPAPTVERSPEPAPEPATAGRVLLFGIDIGVGVQKPAAKEGPSEAEGSASTEK